MDSRLLSNRALMDELPQLARRERGATADFMACLGEADRREKELLADGLPNLFVFCVRELKLAESTAYQRVKTARLTRKRPETLAYLRSGEITLKTLSMIAPHAEEHPELVEKIKGKGRADVEALLAAITPARQIHDKIRLVPAPAANVRPAELFDAPAAEPARKAAAPQVGTAPPAAPEFRAEIKFAAGEPFVAALERLKALLWHRHPAGRLEDVLMTAMSDYLRRHDPLQDRNTAACAPPSNPKSRHIPAAVRRLVWKRDGGRCAFQLCGETRGLEVDHVLPWALGGRSDDPKNLRLLCAAHNQSERRRIFGDTVPGHSPVDNS
jgi:hypothetical protein